MNEPTLEEVEINVDGLRLAGHLRIPANARGPLPALVFTGPFTGVKEQVAGQYAQQLAERGFVTLAFDHRNFGASEGGRPSTRTPQANSPTWLPPRASSPSTRQSTVIESVASASAWEAATR